MNQIEMEILIKQLNEASDAYYNGGEPTMNDIEFDERMELLRQAELETGVVFKDSPLHNVGTVVTGSKVQHDKNHPMLSLDKCHTAQELIDFAGNDPCYLSVKCDGLSTRLCYKCTDGKTAYLVSAATRGDGSFGSNIFEHIHYYDNVPLTVPCCNDLVIDGESVILQNDFNEIIKTEAQYKNPRNLASGTLANQDMNVVKQRHMKFIAWRVIKGWDDSDDNFVKLMNAKHLGFSIAPSWLYENNNIEDRLHTARKTANDNGIPMDGVVLSKCSAALSTKMGRTDKFFKHSIAYKFEDEAYPTTLLDVEWSVGKTNRITPTAKFIPVDIDGSTVERASVCNISIIEKLGLSKGCTCYVRKANCIIPQIIRCDNDGTDIIVPPTICPVCGYETKVTQENESKVLVCTNSECGGSLLGKLSYAVGKKALNIDGLSSATLQWLIDIGWVSSLIDIYHLSDYETEWVAYDGFGITSVKKILASIEKSRVVDLAHFICALNIPNVGNSASKAIAQFCGTWGNFLLKITENCDFTTLPDFGKATNNSIYTWFSKNSEACEKLAYEMKFEVTQPTVIVSNDFISGKTFCVTGAFVMMRRSDLEKIIIDRGGKLSSSISKKVAYLLTNDSDSGSSKSIKAKEFNIPIMSEEDFLSKL